MRSFNSLVERMLHERRKLDEKLMSDLEAVMMPGKVKRWWIVEHCPSEQVWVTGTFHREEDADKCFEEMTEEGHTPTKYEVRPYEKGI